MTESTVHKTNQHQRYFQLLHYDDLCFQSQCCLGSSGHAQHEHVSGDLGRYQTSLCTGRRNKAWGLLKSQCGYCWSCSRLHLVMWADGGVLGRDLDLPDAVTDWWSLVAHHLVLNLSRVKKCKEVWKTSVCKLVHRQTVSLLFRRYMIREKQMRFSLQ
jgi:hypothetical protein